MKQIKLGGINGAPDHRFAIINGRTLDAQAHPLRDHDVVELAGVRMEFFIRGS